MAMASAKAMAKIIEVWIFEEASGLRPIASIALPASQPIAKAGPTEPPTIAMAEAISLTDSMFIKKSKAKSQKSKRQVKIQN